MLRHLLAALLLTSITAASAAAAPPGAELAAAIAKDDSETVAALLGDPAGAQKLDGIPSDWLFDAVVADGPCRASVARVLVGTGRRPKPAHVASAVDHACVGVTEILAEALSDEDAPAAAAQATRALEYRLSQGWLMHDENYDAFNALAAVLTKRCAAQGAGACSAESALRAAAGEAAKNAARLKKLREERAAFDRHPDRVLESICVLKERRAEAIAAIDRERKIETVSGGRDSLLLHDLGAEVVKLDEDAALLAEGYRGRTGKAPPLRRCAALLEAMRNTIRRP